MFNIYSVLEIFRTKRPVPLGRWSVKTCDELKTVFNSIYQNRDHCGDIICKTPKKADEYPPKVKKKSGPS